MKEEPTKFRAVKGMIVMTVKGKQISGWRKSRGKADNYQETTIKNKGFQQNDLEESGEDGEVFKGLLWVKWDKEMYTCDFYYRNHQMRQLTTC